jgi:hypothetical protein
MLSLCINNVAASMHLGSYLESLKVIALDKNGVNSNLSSGNQSSQIIILQHLVDQILLHKVKLSPYLRLVE